MRERVLEHLHHGDAEVVRPQLVGGREHLLQQVLQGGDLRIGQGGQIDEGRDGPISDHRHRPRYLGGEHAVVRVGRQVDAERPQGGEPLVQRGGQIVLQDLHVDGQAPDLGLVHPPPRLIEAPRERR